VGFFQEAGSKEAFNRLKSKGLPILRRILRENMEKPSFKENDLLFILKVLAMYRQRGDIALVIQAARKPVAPGGLLWPIIFNHIDEEHPGWRDLCDGLRSPLPGGFIAIVYLDFVNMLAINSAIKKHPFDSDEGIEKLDKWLNDREKENYSYARSATSALPFISEGKRERLLQLASRHPGSEVRLESAWALAKSGSPDGRKQLIRWCLEPNYSQTASGYLIELGFEKDIPAKCKEPQFRAMSEMCSWLSHPNEFDRPPDNITLYDTRKLYWPPTDDNRAVWLFRYSYKPGKEGEETDTGIGMVGSVTFALFSEATKELSPEDVYGLHCCWELEINQDPRAPKKRTSLAGRQILAKYNRGSNF
jgi:hypothetical protein